MDQYNEIITSRDAWSIIDDESASSDSQSSTVDFRPTVSAHRLKLLVEQVTDRYSPLQQFSQRLRFLVNVQLPLIESYYDRLSASLDAFESLSLAFVRAVPGTLGGERRDGGRLTNGTEGLTRLCKALVSAKLIQSALETWGEDVVRDPSSRAFSNKYLVYLSSFSWNCGQKLLKTLKWVYA